MYYTYNTSSAENIEFTYNASDSFRDDNSADISRITKEIESLKNQREQTLKDVERFDLEIVIREIQLNNILH